VSGACFVAVAVTSDEVSSRATPTRLEGSSTSSRPSDDAAAAAGPRSSGPEWRSTWPRWSRGTSAGGPGEPRGVCQVVAGDRLSASDAAEEDRDVGDWYGDDVDSSSAIRRRRSSEVDPLSADFVSLYINGWSKFHVMRLRTAGTYACHLREQNLANAVSVHVAAPRTWNSLPLHPRLRLFGHLARAYPSQDHSRILRAAVSRPPADWRRRAGRPRRTWLRTIVFDLRHHNLGLNTAWMRAQDHSKWRQLVEMAIMLTDGCAIRWWWFIPMLCTSGECNGRPSQRSNIAKTTSIGVRLGLGLGLGFGSNSCWSLLQWRTYDMAERNIEETKTFRIILDTILPAFLNVPSLRSLNFQCHTMTRWNPDSDLSVLHKL